jgi:hypothetical protein
MGLADTKNCREVGEDRQNRTEQNRIQYSLFKEIAQLGGFFMAG